MTLSIGNKKTKKKSYFFRWTNEIWIESGMNSKKKKDNIEDKRTQVEQEKEHVHWEHTTRARKDTPAVGTGTIRAREDTCSGNGDN